MTPAPTFSPTDTNSIHAVYTSSPAEVFDYNNSTDTPAKRSDINNGDNSDTPSTETDDDDREIVDTPAPIVFDDGGATAGTLAPVLHVDENAAGRTLAPIRGAVEIAITAVPTPARSIDIHDDNSTDAPAPTIIDNGYDGFNNTPDPFRLRYK